MANSDLIYINPEEGDYLIDVDTDGTFMPKHVTLTGIEMPDGGLKVRNGHNILPVIKHRVHKVFPRSHRIRTWDQHPDGHVSLYDSFVGHGPFHALTVQEVRQWTPRDNRIAPKAKFSLSELVDYLEQLESQSPGAGVQMLWTRHGVKDTADGRMHPDLGHSQYAFVQPKGMDPCCDSYSGLKDNLGRPTGLHAQPIWKKVRRLFGEGLALDFCLRWTLINAKVDYQIPEVYCIADSSYPVDVPGNDEVAGSVAKTFGDFAEAGIKYCHSKQLRLVTNPA